MCVTQRPLICVLEPRLMPKPQKDYRTKRKIEDDWQHEGLVHLLQTSNRFMADIVNPWFYIRYSVLECDADANYRNTHWSSFLC